MSVEPREHSLGVQRSPTSNLAIQVAVLSQKLEQSEQLVEELRRREDASKKAYSLLLNAFNDVKSTESEVLIKALRDEIMMLKRDKEHDTYMLRNQCTEILNLVQSSMKKGSYNYPTSRHASVSRDPNRNEDRHRDLGEVGSVHRFVIDGNDDEPSVRRVETSGLYPRGQPDSTSQRDIYRRNETTDSQFYTYRSRNDFDNNTHKGVNDCDDTAVQLEKVKAQLVKKSNKVSKLLSDVAQRDNTINSLKQKIFELTQKSTTEATSLPVVCRPESLSIETIDTVLVGGKLDLSELPDWNIVVQSDNVIIVQRQLDIPVEKPRGMSSWQPYEPANDGQVEYAPKTNHRLNVTDLSKVPRSPKQTRNLENNFNQSPTVKSSSRREERKQNSKSSRKKTTQPIQEVSGGERDLAKVMALNSLNLSKIGNPPQVRKTTSYQCIPAGSLVSSYYGLRREDSRDTLQGDSVRSTEVEKLMQENTKVTKDLRKMFEQFNSVEGFPISEDQASTARNIRKTVGANDRQDNTSSVTSNEVSAEKQRILTNRRNQQLLLQDFMQHGIMETRAEDIQDESDIVGKITNGSFNVSKTGSKAGSPILGQSVQDRSLQRLVGIAADKNSMKSNQSFGVQGSRFGSLNDIKRKEESSNKGSARESGTRGSPRCVNLVIDLVQKCDINTNSGFKNGGSPKENLSAKPKSDHTLKSPLNEGTKNISIRVIEENSQEKAFSMRSSQEDPLFGNQRKRLNGFVDTFKGADVDFEDIRSPENEEEPDIRVPDSRPASKKKSHQKKNVRVNSIIPENDGEFDQTEKGSQVSVQMDPFSPGRQPNVQRSSPTTAKLLQNNQAFEVVEPSLSSNYQSESQLLMEDRKNCSPKYVPSSHRSMYGSQCIDPLADGMEPQAVSSRYYNDEDAADHKQRQPNLPKFSRFELGRPEEDRDLPTATEQHHDDVMIGSKSVSHISAKPSQKTSINMKRRISDFIEEPWFQHGHRNLPVESEVQATNMLDYDFGSPRQENPSKLGVHLNAKKREGANLAVKNHGKLLGDKQKYIAAIPHFDSVYPDANPKDSSLNHFAESSYHEPQKFKRKISLEKEARPEDHKRLQWQASGVSIRELTTPTGRSAKKRSPVQEGHDNSLVLTNMNVEPEFVIYRRNSRLGQDRLQSSKISAKDTSNASMTKSDMTAKEGRDGRRPNLEKTSYRDLMNYIRQGSNEPNKTQDERSRSRKARSVINHNPGGMDDTDSKSVRSNISGFKQDGRRLTTNEKKHMKFKTDYCGIIKHIAINLVEESGSTSNSPSPYHEVMAQKKGPAAGAGKYFTSFMEKRNDSVSHGESSTKFTLLRQCATTMDMKLNTNPDLPNPIRSPVNKLSGIHARRHSQITKPQNNPQQVQNFSHEIKLVEALNKNRRNSQKPDVVKQITPTHSRRPSNVSVANSQKSNTKKMGIGQKAKMYMTKPGQQEAKENKKDQDTSCYSTKTGKTGPSKVDLYQPKANKENKPAAKIQAKVNHVHDEYNQRVRRIDTKTRLPVDPVGARSPKTESSFLGIRINDIQNLYNTEEGQSSRRNTDRSNNYVLKCRGSPLSNCKYSDVSRPTDKNLYGQRAASRNELLSTVNDNSTKGFGKQTSNVSNLHSSSLALMERQDQTTSAPQKSNGKLECSATKAKDKERVSYISKLNDTVFSAHDSIVMMHEILVDKVSDLTNKLIVHERSSSKKPRFNQRLTLEVEDRLNQK